jgi:tetratricopeptide (TPR) repeat protein
MKQIVLTIALCFVVSLTFAQKKNIKAAKTEVEAANPDFNEAHKLIGAALENPESKDLAETWYTAGWIENKQFDTEKTKQILGTDPNKDVMFDALFNIKAYFEKADEIEQTPDEKGKIKAKHRKDMRSILKVNHLDLINGGAYNYEKKDYKRAYAFFEQYLEIPDMKMFDDEPIVSKTDSNYLNYKYYAALSASQIPDHAKAIALYEELLSDDFNTKDIIRYLSNEYSILKDTVNLIRVLKDGANKFPENSFFLLTLINQYIYTNQKEDAINFLNKAIEQSPENVQLYSTLGSIYEEIKEPEKAKDAFNRALSLNPESHEAQSSVGRMYFNKGVELRSAANDIADQKKYMEALKISNEKFKEALPFFEKAHQLKPDEKDYLIALKGIYYNLNMGKEYEVTDAKLNKLTE